MPSSPPAWIAIGISAVAIVVTIIGWPVVHYLTKRRERQRDAEARARAKERDVEAAALARQRSREAAVACIDRIVMKVSGASRLPPILIGTRGELETLVFAFARAVSPERRERIHAAWKPYAALKERHVHRDAHWTKRDASGVVDVAKMRAAMLDPLKKLRDEIAHEGVGVSD
jgi:hypothetical protein